MIPVKVNHDFSGSYVSTCRRSRGGIAPATASHSRIPWPPFPAMLRFLHTARKRVVTSEISPRSRNQRRTNLRSANRKPSRSARASADAPLRRSPSRHRNHSRDEGPGGSLRAFARDDVGVPPPQPLSAPLQAGIRFLRLPLPAAPSAFLTVHLPIHGRGYGLTVFRMNNWKGQVLPLRRESVSSVRRDLGHAATALHAFWLKPTGSPSGLFT
jgi:hypothetical protein